MRRPPPFPAVLCAFPAHLRVSGGELRSLKHPNLVSYLGCGHRDRHSYLFVQWMSGGSLEALLEDNASGSPSPAASARGSRGGMPEQLVCKYIKSILMSLHFLHSMGKCHGDVKVRVVVSLRDDRDKAAHASAHRSPRPWFAVGGVVRVASRPTSGVTSRATYC